MVVFNEFLSAANLANKRRRLAAQSSGSLRESSISSRSLEFIEINADAAVGDDLTIQDGRKFPAKIVQASKSELIFVEKGKSITIMDAVGKEEKTIYLGSAAIAAIKKFL